MKPSIGPMWNLSRAISSERQIRSGRSERRKNMLDLGDVFHSKRYGTGRKETLEHLFDDTLLKMTFNDLWT
eukprot:scaffold5885_cov201-Amphora_coffeaeformis.AAC.17